MIVRSAFTFLIACFWVSSDFAQNIEWEENLGGDTTEKGLSIVQTDDDGFVVAGRSNSSNGDVGGNKGAADVWIVKLDNSGTLQWERNFGGSDDDIAHSILQTSDNGFMVAAASYSSDGDVGGNNGGGDLWLLKLDNSGALQWEKNFGSSGDERPRSIVRSGDGGFVIAGSSDSSGVDVGGNNGGYDYWIVKVDSSGNLQWESNYGGAGTDFAFSVDRTADGGFVTVGYSDSADGDVGSNQGGADAWVVKVDSSGSFEWENNFGGSDADRGRSVVRSSDGGIAVLGEVASSDGDLGGSLAGNNDYWMLKLNENGVLQWEENYGGSDYDYATTIARTSDGGFVLGGGAGSQDGDVGGTNGLIDHWVLKIDNNGNIQWKNAFGDTYTDIAQSIVQTADGGYAEAGITQSSDGDVGGNNGLRDIWVVKLDGQGTALPQEEAEDAFDIQVNANSDRVRIDLGKKVEEVRLTIRDMNGQVVKRQKREGVQAFRTTIEEKPGAYFVELETNDGGQEVKKVVIK